jgi:hypothetical protein
VPPSGFFWANLTEFLALRLRVVKAAVDPTGVFWCHHGTTSMCTKYKKYEKDYRGLLTLAPGMPAGGSPSGAVFSAESACRSQSLSSESPSAAASIVACTCATRGRAELSTDH